VPRVGSTEFFAGVRLTTTLSAGFRVRERFTDFQFRCASEANQIQVLETIRCEDVTMDVGQATTRNRSKILRRPRLSTRAGQRATSTTVVSLVASSTTQLAASLTTRVSVPLLKSCLTLIVCFMQTAFRGTSWVCLLWFSIICPNPDTASKTKPTHTGVTLADGSKEHTMYEDPRIAVYQAAIAAAAEGSA
jgi:hypothetical protein